MTDLYATLGVPKDAPPDAVRKAYRKMARSGHPDHGGSPEKFQELVLARDVLTDEARREKYDRTGRADPAEADAAESKAMNLVAEAVNHVWAVCRQRGINVLSVDVVKDARTYLQGKLHEGEAKRDQIAEAAKDLRKFAERFKVKKDRPNRVRAMLEGSAAEGERGVEAAEVLIAAHKRAIEILKDHSYDWESGHGVDCANQAMLAQAFYFR